MEVLMGEDYFRMKKAYTRPRDLQEFTEIRDSHTQIMHVIDV